MDINELKRNHITTFGSPERYITLVLKITYYRKKGRADTGSPCGEDWEKCQLRWSGRRDRYDPWCIS